MRLLVIMGGYPDIGKGILTAACGYLLQRAGLRVSPIKYDGFLNRQPELLPDYHSPAHFQYADEEIFALGDGWAADNDLGYYERFLDIAVTRAHQRTNGDAFTLVFARENEGYYPTGEILNFNHVRDVLAEWIVGHLRASDAVVLEVGGTVGDRESEIMFDALQGLKRHADITLGAILVAPYFPTSDPQCFPQSRSTKLTRQSAAVARKLGLPPDAVLLRVPEGAPVAESDRRYISFEVGIPHSRIMACPRVASIYALPRVLVEHGLASALSALLSISAPTADGPLEEYCKAQGETHRVLKVAVPGRKRPSDSQISLSEALSHAATMRGARIERQWLEEMADDGEIEPAHLDGIDAVVIPDVMADPQLIMSALRVARAMDLPTLAISYGADLLVLEFARHVCQSPKAFIEELGDGVGELKIVQGQPACGDWSIRFEPDSLLAALYDTQQTVERSRHRSWASRQLTDRLGEHGLRVTAWGCDDTPEAFELAGHPFYVGIKPRPEYLSRPMRPSPVFLGLIDAALARQPRALG